MSAPPTLQVYVDYKSPYAFLAKDLVYDLAATVPVHLDWRPYVLDIPSYLGSAEVDETGRVTEESRNAHQWRRVRYSYMDCRREAGKRGLTIRGTRRIWDSTLAAAGMLHALQGGEDVFRRYNDAVFERFWRRELDIEDVNVLSRVLADSGAAAGFMDRTASLRTEVAAIGRSAEAEGIFGVPTFVLEREIFWGREHLPVLRDKLARSGQ